MTTFFSTDIAELLSAENLAKLFAINNMATGIGVQFAPQMMMKKLRNFEKSAGNEEARIVGAYAFSYGLLPFLSMIQNVDPLEAMAWSLVQIAAHLLYRDVDRSSKSPSYKKNAAVTASTLLVCAYYLATGGSIAAVALIPIIFLGTIGVLQILFPGFMIQALELVTTPDGEFFKNKPTDYELRVVTQGSGLHSLCYLVQFFALWKGTDAVRAVGYSMAIAAALFVLVCFI